MSEQHNTVQILQSSKGYALRVSEAFLTRASIRTFKTRQELGRFIAEGSWIDD